MMFFLPSLPHLASLMVLAASPASMCSLQTIPPPPPEIVITVRHADIKYDRTKSFDDFKNFSIDTVSPYTVQEKTHVGGLMGGDIQVKSSTTAARVALPSTGEGCIWYKKIEVVIENSPTVYIASNYKDTGCWYKETLAHEMKHVLTDHILINQLQTDIEKAVRDYTERTGVIGPEPKDVLAGLVQSLPQSIDLVIKAEVEKMQTHRATAQQDIDSREEYDHLSDLCKNEPAE